MKAARFTRLTTKAATKLTKNIAGYSLATILLTYGFGTACGAQNAAPPTLDSLAAQANGTTTPEAQGTTPELQAAADRVAKAKANLELAHQRLNASKAVLKAADAEYKASKADQQALSLRTQASEMANSAGMNEATNMMATAPSGVPSNAARTTPAAAVPASTTAPSSDGAETPFDFSGVSQTNASPSSNPTGSYYTSGPTPGK